MRESSGRRRLGGMTGLERPPRGAMLAGVCAGIANRFGWRPGLVRLAFVLSCILPGPQIALYLLLWLLMPRAKRSDTTFSESGDG